MSVEITKISHNEYGNCLRMFNSAAELLVTLDYGPRIRHLSLAGGENLLYSTAKDAVMLDGEAFDKAYYKGAQFKIRGGHRLWRSPEILPETYYPDNDPVACEIVGGTVKLTCAPQLHNYVQIRLEITMDETQAKITIVHHITNLSDGSMTFAPWALTMMGKGGLEIVPMNTRDTGLLANRAISVWSYANLACERVAFHDRYFTLRQNPANARAFKIGFDNEAGWAAYINHQTLFVKRYNHVLGGSYPDNGCSYETYTNSEFLEMETLGELREAASGETLTHTEYWSLKAVAEMPNQKDADAIEAFVKEYID